MKQFYIAELQQKHVNYPFLAHHAPTEEKWAIFREGWSKLKSHIKETKSVFYNKMLSSKQKIYLEVNA